MNRMKISFGDYYDDGHGKYVTLDMYCNRTVNELFEIEKKAEKKTGYRFQTNDDQRLGTTTICSDYEDSSIKDEIVQDLISQGFDNIITYDDQEYPLHVLEDGMDDFAEFFMRWLKMADPDLQWRFADQDEIPHAVFNCRGYGMFW